MKQNDICTGSLFVRIGTVLMQIQESYIANDIS